MIRSRSNLGWASSLLVFMVSCSSPLAPIAQDTLGAALGAGEPRGGARMLGPIYDVKTYGAKGNGTSMDTAAIQNAINACSQTGGTVLLSGGTFLSATLYLKSNMLKSNMTFYIDATATLKGSKYSVDYPDLFPNTVNNQLRNCRKALLYTVDASNVVIEGGGTIDGQNSLYDKFSYKEYYRPMAIFSALSTNVTIKNLKVKNSAMWSVVSMEVTGLTISGLTVTSQNITRDGIDVVDCHQVLIENCNINSGDDGICLKSGSPFGLADIVVRNSTIQSYCNAIKFGTPTYGPITNILFQDITIQNTRFAGIAVEAIDGSDESNITFRRITMSHVGTPFFVLLGDRGNTPTGGTYPHKIGSIDGLHFIDITADHMDNKWGSMITGTVINGVTYRPRNITFENVDITFDGGRTTVPGNPPEYVGQYPECDMWGDLPAYGYWIRHVDGLSMMNCTTALSGSDVRKWMVLNDALNVTNASTGSTNPVTTVRVHKDVLYCNYVSVRGSVLPLSWSTGLAATWTGGNVWIWKTTAFANLASFQFKSLKNDSTWESGGNHLGTGGETIDIYPTGY